MNRNKKPPQILIVRRLLFIIFTKYMFEKSSTSEEDYYTNEEGYRVFTEKYHLKRGYCCKSGCKHCPYGYDKKTDRIKN